MKMCETCIHSESSSTRNPCLTCLYKPGQVNYESSKPVNWLAVVQAVMGGLIVASAFLAGWFR